MCGICGKLTNDGTGIDRDVLGRMNGAIAHRGPDDDGFYYHDAGSVSVGLAHRRLSIIDLSSAGRQPMPNEDETVWIVFNGEIYNFQDLRAELLAKGHRFRSQTDTEVIIHLYEEEGAACVGRLTGMFAFAIWDAKRESLFLARDHIGIKPIVYAWDGARFSFASEIQALLADPDLHREMDEDVLNLYLCLNYIPAPYSIFKGVRKLRPGHTLTLSAGKLSEEPYWNLDLEAGAHRTERREEDLKRVLFDTLSGAVKSQMIADVPLGAFLSGGIDSSIVVALMARQSAKPVKTYTIGYEDMPLYDESAFAADVARMYATDHHEIRLRSQEMRDVAETVLCALDEPFADSSAIPTYIVSRETVRDVKVALSGDGGDELFAGYRMYRGEGWYERYRQVPAFLRKGIVEPVIRALPDSRDAAFTEYVRRAKKFLRGTGNTLEERFLALNTIFAHDLRRELLLNLHPEADAMTGSVFGRRLAEMADDSLNRMLYADLKESLPGDMLRKVDAMSMANSLEVRVPLLDHHVCETAFAMAGAWKLRAGRSKYILIETFRDLLPASILTKPKSGFEIPISKWLKTDLNHLIQDYLSPERLRRQSIFNAGAVQTLVARLMSGRSDTSWQIWNLIAFQVWYERHL